jgi:two-component system, sensor histidine kinase
VSFRPSEKNILSGKTAKEAWLERYGEALRLSNVVLFGQDEKLRYQWIENHPEGVTTAAVEGLSDKDILPVATALQILPAKQQVLQSGTPRTIEFQWQIGEGARWFELRIEAARDPQGRIMGLNCAAIDVSVA